MLDCEADTSPVRIADLSDEDEVLDSVRRMQDDREWALCDAAGAPLPFCAPKARQTIRRALIRQHNDPDILPAWIGVIGAPGRLQASIYVSVVESWCSDETNLVQLWSYVLPEFRKSANGVLLIAFAKGIAASLHIPLYSAVQRSTGKQRFYERAFGAPVGALFRYSADVAPAGMI